MVLCQILIPPTQTDANGNILPNSNNSYFDVPFSGTCNISLVNIQYDESKNNDQIIQIISDQLYMPQSAIKHFVFSHSKTKRHTVLNVDSSINSINFKNVDLRGRIFLNVVDVATNAQPDGFVALILTLDIEDLTHPAPR